MRFFLFLFLFGFSNSGFSQYLKNVEEVYSIHSLKDGRDTVYFAVTNKELSIKKPVLLFCQGSLPYPLFEKVTIDDANYYYPLLVGNFDVEALSKDYHLVIISNPNTPVVASSDQLNPRQHFYVPDISKPNERATEFLKNDYAEKYVERAELVLKWLRKQSWVDKDKLVVFGHSQGSRVAVQLAAKNKKVTQLGLFGYSPERRIDQISLSFRKQAEMGEISWQQADSLQNDYKLFYETILNDDSLKANPGLISWRSFCKSTKEQLLGLKIPVYIANGSRDLASDFCDYLPLDFLEVGKSDYVLKRYPNLEHNFFPVLEDGKNDYKNGQWKPVLQDFLDWLRLANN